MPRGGAGESDVFPRQIGSYTVLRCIGVGGMGAVFEALQAQPQRRVAVKLIRPEQVSDELLLVEGIPIDRYVAEHPAISR